MGTQGTKNGRANALTQEVVVEATKKSTASPERVYDVLGDLRTHAIWGGEMQSKKTRIASIDAPAGPATVGTEFSTEGIDMGGPFTDRSVVTQASRPEVF